MCAAARGLLAAMAVARSRSLPRRGLLAPPWPACSAVACSSPTRPAVAAPALAPPWPCPRSSPARPAVTPPVLLPCPLPPVAVAALLFAQAAIMAVAAPVPRRPWLAGARTRGGYRQLHARRLARALL
nr:vegetative cell wall protein gp1-like [Aegilops tauschii subsp. strangulata]